MIKEDNAYVDKFRKNVFKRVGGKPLFLIFNKTILVKTQAFVEQERTCEELYEEEDLQTGPEFIQLCSSENDHLINIEGGDNDKLILK